MAVRSSPGFTISPSTQVQTSGLNLDLGFTERRCQLTVMSGPQTGRSVEVSKATFSVGKGDECDLVITDPTVSRVHFVIEQQQGAYVIRDNTSTNGTWIDQFRIREAYLRPGVVLRAGQVQLKFESLFKPIEIAPSQADKFGHLVGHSVRMRQIFTMLERVAKTDATVVIFGETGTGKSAIAQAIHEASALRSLMWGGTFEGGTTIPSSTRVLIAPSSRTASLPLNSSRTRSTRSRRTARRMKSYTSTNPLLYARSLVNGPPVGVLARNTRTDDVGAVISGAPSGTSATRSAVDH